jgi:hypothetical protein
MTELEEMSNISDASINYIDIPLDTETLYTVSPYATEVREAMEESAPLSHELSIFHLKNQLV